MTLFDKLFGSPEARLANRILKETGARVSATYGPVGDLGKTIVQAADGSYRALAPVVGFSLTGTPSELQTLVFYEMLYFFSHLTLRSVRSAGFTEAQIEKLQGYLGPLLTSTAVDTFFRHWPDDLKTKMCTEVYERLNDAEVDYSECRGLISEDDPFSGATLLGRLARNVAELSEKPLDAATRVAVVTGAADAYSHMELETHIKNVRAVIDSVEAPPRA